MFRLQTPFDMCLHDKKSLKVTEHQLNCYTKLGLGRIRWQTIFFKSEYQLNICFYRKRYRSLITYCPSGHGNEDIT